MAIKDTHRARRREFENSDATALIVAPCLAIGEAYASITPMIPAFEVE